MKFPNTFVVFGEFEPPIVKLLTEGQVKLFSQRESVSDRAKAIVATFGTGYQYALPAWSIECMEMIALRYEGPFQKELRGICAAIALGQPYGPDIEGGLPILAQPTPPVKPSPTGAARKPVKRLARAVS